MPSKTLQEWIDDCKGYCVGVEFAKEIDGEPYYQAQLKPGIKIHSLGIFPSKVTAVEVLYNYLLAHRYISLD